MLMNLSSEMSGRLTACTANIAMKQHAAKVIQTNLSISLHATDELDEIAPSLRNKTTCRKT